VYVESCLPGDPHVCDNGDVQLVAGACAWPEGTHGADVTSMLSHYPPDPTLSEPKSVTSASTNPREAKYMTMPSGLEAKHFLEHANPQLALAVYSKQSGEISPRTS
jgi:hypothetical protein